MLTKMAVVKGNKRTGTTNVRVKMNFERNVDNVASHISLDVWAFSDSSEMWIPRASEKASAIAIVRIPPITTFRDPVPEWRPTIRPSVVITPDVSPKLRPVFKECLIFIIDTMVTVNHQGCNRFGQDSRNTTSFIHTRILIHI